jgi:hypothetical protein
VNIPLQSTPFRVLCRDHLPSGVPQLLGSGGHELDLAGEILAQGRVGHQDAGVAG